MKIGVLTSSRADYGIYLPLLDKLKFDQRFQLEIIAFGMHLQNSQGNTIGQVIEDGYQVVHKVGEMPESDGVIDISKGYGNMVVSFAEFWSQNKFDIVFALGDRWEMSAAVQASIPFEVKIGHIHGGETTLGATDNIYRHQITLASTYHFTAAEVFSERVISILGSSANVHTVGSISLENIDKLNLPSWDSVKEWLDIPFDNFILVTFHPESVGASMNKYYASVISEVLKTLVKEHNILVTKANSDAMGSLFNDCFQELQKEYPKKIKLVSALGKLNYFKAMDTCDFMLGNTSSGIIEAASFGKYVINVGDRQKGRLRNENVKDVQFESDVILMATKHVAERKHYCGENKYIRIATSNRIIKIIAQDEGL
ncbi:UDP-N-acetylglucosamine 2-epimerase [Schleiferiaceae bacterium]|nr:UDP-N-acetylglucosamine 2-epimerase [Schleiferiaceae bacterium]